MNLTPAYFSTSTIEAIVELQFRDAPIAIKIAKCESGYRNIRSNKINSDGTYDWGIFQINEIHRAEALTLGYDIEDPIANIKYARVLYLRNGTRDWNASKPCWKPAPDG